MTRTPGGEDFRAFCLALSGQENTFRQALAHRAWDWSRFVEGAQRHRVEQQLLAALKAANVPLSSALADLRSEARIAAHRSLLQMAETARLAGLFDQANIPLILLKGVALSLQLHRDPARRSSRDIDLLVGLDDMARATVIMHGAGYRNSGPNVPETMEEDYRRWSKEAEFVHSDHGMFVELHHRLSDNNDLLDHDFQELWRQRDVVEIGGQPVAVMPRHHLAVYLCVHGATHGWERLSWLADLKDALSRPEEIERALQSAGERGLSAPMLQGIQLAHDWLGLPVRQDHLARARSCRRVTWLNMIVNCFYGPSQWYQSPQRGTFAGFMRYSVWLRLYVYSLKPGWRYLKNQMVREFITPADWDAFRLPKSLLWLYPVMRPIGWLARRLFRAI